LFIGSDELDGIDDTTEWCIDEFMKDITKAGEDKKCKF
jgi:hypothetical protein